jgi:hypothetical protein
MKKIFIVLFSAFVVFLLVTNLTIAKYYFPRPAVCQYQTSDGICFREIPKRKDPYGDIVLAFEEHKSKKPDQVLLLNRCTKRDWTLVWEWFEYLVHPRFKHKRIECNCT